MDDRSIQETIREEWKKLSKLSWGERIVYIWDYYKPLMAAIACVILAISIGVSIYHNMQINTLLNAYFINCNALDADGDAIAADFAAYLGGIGEKDEIHVDVKDGYLTVSAQKGLDKDEEDKKGRVLRQERYAGACSRSFYVGDVKAEDVKAKYENGVLKLFVPKAEVKQVPAQTAIAIE